MKKILILSSDIHTDLAEKQRQACLNLVNQYDYDYQLEILKAGTYEMPFVIQTYNKIRPFAGYLVLGLIVKTNIDHYHFIMEHLSKCFTRFALEGVPVGNGIIIGSNLEELSTRIESNDPCLCAYSSALKALDYLIRFKEKLASPL